MSKSVQFSRSVVSNSLQPHESQHARPPCPSPTPGVHSDSCPLRQWWHPTISSSVIPFSSHLQSFPASRSFPNSQLFASDTQSIGASASASVFPMNIQDYYPLGLTYLISLQPKELSRPFSNSTVWKYEFFSLQPSLWFNFHIHTWLLEKNIALTRQIFVSKVMSLLFKTFSRFVIAFLPRSRCLSILFLQWPSAVILEPKKNTVCYCFHCFPPWSDGTRCHDLHF